MAPTATTPEAHVAPLTSVKGLHAAETSTMYKEPLLSTGPLDKFTSFEVTPAVGREYPSLQLSDLMKSSNRDQFIRDLAIIGMPPFAPYNCPNHLFLS
jgi:hypothetical protein